MLTGISPAPLGQPPHRPLWRVAREPRTVARRGRAARPLEQAGVDVVHVTEDADAGKGISFTEAHTVAEPCRYVANTEPRLGGTVFFSSIVSPDSGPVIGYLGAQLSA